MSWAAKRKTTRPENIAYCLLGIFNVNMPLLYGEGHKAFTWLQKEIIEQSDDESIFAWRCTDPGWSGDRMQKCFLHSGVLALDPSHFDFTGLHSFRSLGRSSRSPYRITNKGLELEAKVSVFRKHIQPGVAKEPELYIVGLACALRFGESRETQCTLVLERERSLVGEEGRGPNDVYRRLNRYDLGENIHVLYPPSNRVDIGLTRFYITLD